MIVVHILDRGRPLCGFSDKVPADWPKDHRWTGADGASDANCPGCLAVLKAGIETPPGSMPHIGSIWAVLATDADGNEGVVAAPLQEGMLSVPLIAADEARLRSILPLARAMAKASGMSMRLVRFTTREEVEVL